MTDPFVREMTSELIGRLGRRGFIKVAATVGVGAGIAGVASACTDRSGSPHPRRPLRHWPTSRRCSPVRAHELVMCICHRNQIRCFGVTSPMCIPRR